MSNLTDLHLRMLAFERKWFARPGSREQAILTEFGMSITRYTQLLHGLIDQPAAVSADPITVRRLQRVRDQRIALRRGA